MRILLLCLGLASGLRAKIDGPELTYYQELCVESSADRKTIGKAYKQQALKWHPDTWMVDLMRS